MAPPRPNRFLSLYIVPLYPAASESISTILLPIDRETCLIVVALAFYYIKDRPLNY